jgi:hypothetical protein
MLTAHILTILNSAPPPPPPAGQLVANPAPPMQNAQAGFANPFLLAFVALLALACLSGCAEIAATVSAATTAGTANEKVAAKNLVAADTLKAQTAADTFCTMTVGTLFTNPQWVKPVQSLCWTGSQVTPSDAAGLIPGAGTVPAAAIPTPAK